MSNEKTLDATRKKVTEHLSSLKDFQVISDFQIGDVWEHTTTWETLYPFMPQRLRAIEAEENHYSIRFSAPPPNVADLYYEAHFYTWVSSDFIDCTSNDYRGSIDNNYDRELDLENKPDNVEEIETLCWKMRVPDTVIRADAYIRPIQPIKNITLNVKLTRDGATFDEAIKEL